MSWDEKAVQAALNRTVNDATDGPDHETVPVRREDLRALRRVALDRDLGAGTLMVLDGLDDAVAAFTAEGVSNNLGYTMTRATWEAMNKPLTIHVRAKRSNL